MPDTKKNKPLTDQKEVQKSNDAKIDQDFPGYPNLPAKEEIIKPENKKDEKDAGLELHDSNHNTENNTYGAKKKTGTDEILSDGSAGAFDATENVTENSDTNKYIRKNK